MKFFKSFHYAARGIIYAFRHETNFRVHVVISALVIILMFVLDLESWEYIFLIYGIASVLVLEIINTVFERVTDILKPRVHPYAEAMKDLMAAAVLIASIGAVFVGAIIILPHLIEIYQDFV